MAQEQKFRPMLAGKVGLEIPLPMLASPKLDGVRCLVIDGVACGRSLKPIPNKYVQKLLGKKSLSGLDGELIVGPSTAKDVFQKTTSGVMSEDGTPKFTFWAFDCFTHQGGFDARLWSVAKMADVNDHVKMVPHLYVSNNSELLKLEADYLSSGYEGLMLRALDGPYKFGRSTTKEAYLLKLKRFEDSEARIIGVSELMQNTNEAKRNELGYLERSSHKSHKVGKQCLGAITVVDLKTGIEFDIGTGFNQLQRLWMWSKADSILGRVIKYKSQPTGVKDKPRFPVFLGFRDEIDL